MMPYQQVQSDKDSCKITIYREINNSLENSEINQMFRKYNEALCLMFNIRFYDFDLLRNKNYEKLKTQINFKQFGDEDQPKAKKIATELKEKLLFKLWSALNKSNGFNELVPVQK